MALCISNRVPVIVTMWLKVPILCIFKSLFIHKLYGFTRWHFISTFDRRSTCIDPGTVWMEYIYSRWSRCFILLSYIGLALDRTVVQSSYLVHLESDVEPLNECSFASVCLSRYLLERQEKIVPLWNSNVFYSYWIFCEYYVILCCWGSFCMCLLI